MQESGFQQPASAGSGDHDARWQILPIMKLGEEMGFTGFLAGGTIQFLDAAQWA
jgi:hypothetical protein